MAEFYNEKGNFEPQLVAVYGSLRAGLGNHVVLGDSKLLDTTKTKDDFKMWSYGAFPGAGIGSNSMVVEVYEVVDGRIMRGLDHLEGYPDFYNRKQVELKNGMTAWIYYIEHPEDYVKDCEHIEDWYVFKNNI